MLLSARRHRLTFPRRPLVMGTVYNGDNSYPYPMPGSKTQSGIKTDSVSGDGYVPSSSASSRRHCSYTRSASARLPAAMCASIKRR